MRKIAGALAAWVFLTATAWCAPLDATVIPGSSRWIIHVDAEAFKMSSTYAEWRKLIVGLPVERHLQGLAAVSGVNPFDDVQSITLCGPDAVHSRAIAMIQGRFDRDRLTTLAQGVAGITSTVYNGATIYSWPDPRQGTNKRGWGAFLRTDLIAFAADEAPLKAAIDTIAGQSPALDGAMTDWAGTRGSFFFLGAAKGLATMDGVHPNAAIVQRVVNARVNMGEAEGELVFEALIEADSAEAAEQMRQMVDGFRAMLLLKSKDNPDAAGIASAIEVAVSGSSLSIRFHKSVPTLFDVLRKKVEAFKNRTNARLALPAGPVVK